MKGIILASHGQLADGLYDALKMFSGDIEQIATLSLKPEADLKEFIDLLEEKVKLVDSGDGVTVFVDLLFGTPNNLSGKLLKDELYQEKVDIITGMNLPMVLEYTNSRIGSPSVDDIMSVGKDGITYFNDILKDRQ
ncbi:MULTISPECIES: PTS sugar transporter subunit IIA [Aerococcus]|uniref:PTS sugar transporter subunit IIA n=1 Tax=Aerococcus tenax TaxID=3078812 RepID=A0A5N1BP32_9LACT|nr:PTS sugar transporter subunit IIA [Aerococcus urinae]KAA9240341.1 PTS sugar transporter subunit IIA [Aerococcus urinae]MDK7302796.1 PTS sugar transporter subunit IIA [Aerococcus urinae]MDK7801420.1 PTS sugar transporter subunit IIA [Aerococcus urinae]MDK8655040.1 PTS sugar transporter subunit IIA [Aerococcus urinae]RAV70833.1 PTS mannose transporter subunit IIA [Aerococcus urinae]